MTGNDIVKALTHSGLLDKEIESIEFDSCDWEAVFVFEKSHEYIGEDTVRYHDVHLVIGDDGKWKLTNEIWIG